MMKKLGIILAILALFSCHAVAQQGGDATSVRVVTSLPSSCEPGHGYNVMFNDAPYYCNSAGHYVSAGGGAAAGAANDIQCNILNSFANCAGVAGNAKFDAIFFGPNPYIDIRSTGARSYTSLSAPVGSGITANCTASNATIPISAASSFQNGDYIVAYGCGTSHSLTAPTGITVTPSVALKGTGVGKVTPSAAGATTYNYQIAACTKTGGCSIASSVASTTTGQAALGPQSLSISSCAIANDIATCITAAAHPFLVGCTSNVACGNVTITGASNNVLNGVWAIQSSANNTTFTFSGNFDSRSGVQTSSTGGTATYYPLNRIAWTPVSGAFLYVVWGRTGGSLTFLGFSKPQASGNPDPTFDDYGSPMMDHWRMPGWASNTPLASATNNYLSTYIVSGAGTTNLVVNTAPSASVSSTGFRFDDGPAILAAAAKSVSNGTAGGAIYIPGDASGIATYYPVNSYINLAALSNSVTILQAGTLYLNAPIEGRVSLKWYGDRPFPQMGTAPSFGNQSGPAVYVDEAYPGLYFGTTNHAQNVIKGLVFTVNTGAVQNNALLIFAEGQFISDVEETTFVTGTTTNDYMGIAMYLHGAAGSQSDAFGTYRRVTFSSGYGLNGSLTPVWACNDCGATDMQQIFFVHRGGMFIGDPSGGSNLTMNLAYNQGPQTPFLMLSDLYQARISLNNATIDTGTLPYLVAFPPVTGSEISWNYGTAVSASNPSTGTSPLITGSRMPLEGPTMGDLNTTTASRMAAALTYGSSNNGISGGASDYLLNLNQGGVAVGPMFSIFELNAPPAAPTCSVTAGGSVALGTYTFKVVPTWWDSSEGVASLPSIPCTATSGNQTLTVNWTKTGSPEPKYYNVYASNGGGFATCTGCGSNLTTNPAIVLTSGTPGAGGNSISTVPASGPTAILPGVQGIATPALLLEGPTTGAVTSVIAPNATANRTLIAPDASGLIAVGGAPLSVSDSFNRTDGAIGSNWTAVTNSQNVASNTVKGNTGGAENIMYWSANSFNSAVGLGQFSQMTTTTVSTSRGGPGVYLGLASGNGGYMCTENASSLAIWTIFNGAANTSLASSSITGTVGDFIRIEVSTVAGTQTINCWLNSGPPAAPTLTANNSLTTSGQPGIEEYATVGRGDNWSGGFLHPIEQTDIEADHTVPGHFPSMTIGSDTSCTTGVPAAGTLCETGLITAKGGIDLSPATAQILSVFNTPSATVNANISATNMVASTSAEHTYLLNWTVSLVTPGTSCAGSTTVEVHAVFTDPNASGTIDQNVSGTVTVAASGNGTAGFIASGVSNIRAKTTTAVQYAAENFTAGTSCSPAPTFKIYPVLTQLN